MSGSWEKFWRFNMFYVGEKGQSNTIFSMKYHCEMNDVKKETYWLEISKDFVKNILAFC